MDVKSARTVVVTGANRGLGLEFVRQLLARGERVVAGCRRPGHADAYGIELPYAGFVEKGLDDVIQTVEVEGDVLADDARSRPLAVLLVQAHQRLRAPDVGGEQHLRESYPRNEAPTWRAEPLGPAAPPASR